MKKIIASLFLVLVCVITFTSPALAIVSKVDSYVADYANVLSDSTERDIISANAALEKATGGQIVVVTVEYLDGLKSSEYAVRLMNEWGVGDAKKKNGMLLLLATQENKAWLTQGAGIREVFTDSKINSLFDKYFWKEFDKGNYDKAVNAFFKQLVGWYESYYKVDVTDGNSGTGGFSIFNSLSAMLIAGAIAVFLIFYLFGRSAGRRYYRGMGQDYPGPRPRSILPYLFFANSFFGHNRHRHNHFDDHDRWGGGGFGGFGGGSSGGGGGGRD